MASAPRWPTAVDYQAALQVPALCFRDESLKCGTLTTDAMGLPQAATGNVVAVFRMQHGGRDVALRCFTRKSAFDTLARRYEAISELEQSHHLPAIAACRFRPDEVLVGEQRYAVVEMEWVEGQHLHQFIEGRLGWAGTLHTLADRWRILMARLQTARLAHGDLSDGNVLVDAAGQLRLIDYDALYLPTLADVPPDELGKPNYQHPHRLRPDDPAYGYYAENADAFAALAIYLTLRAIAEDPARWGRFHTGENLLFQQEDFEQPGETPLWHDLEHSRDAEVRRLAALLEEFCSLSPSELPALEDALRRRPAARQRRAETPAAAEAAKASSPPEWLSLLQDQHDAEEALPGPVPVLAEEAPPRWWQRPRLAGGVGAALLVALVAGAVWFSGGRVQHADASLPPAPIRDLAPATLAGFYTGYATTEEGTREPLALTLEADPAGPHHGPAKVRYFINWKAFQANGIGTYDQTTGRLSLREDYELYVAAVTDQEMVLASLVYQGADPLIKVKRNRTP